MLPFLRKHWFLLLILFGTFIVAVRPEWLGWAQRLDPTICGAIAVFLSAWTLETRSLKNAIVQPWAALWALVISYGLLPVAGLTAGRILPDPDYRLGLLLVTSVPCTLVSAVIWTRLAQGDDATALLITFLANCTSWLATTAWLTLAPGNNGPALDAGPLMLKLVLVLTAPTAVGQLLRIPVALHRTATNHRALLDVAARLLTVAIMLKAAVEVRARFGGEQDAPTFSALGLCAVVCLAVHLFALGIGWWSSRVFGIDRPRSIAVAFGGSQKTLPISLILFDAYFRDSPLAVIPIVFYHFGQLIADTFIAERLAMRSAEKQDPATKESNGLLP
jgi:sodium/bile acid cotransporter 7